jgi:hypothetical protein
MKQYNFYEHNERIAMTAISSYMFVLVTLIMSFLIWFLDSNIKEEKEFCKQNLCTIETHNRLNQFR